MKRTKAQRSYSHYEAAFWAGLMAGQPKSGQSVKNYCQAQGVHPSSFYRWKKLLKPNTAPAPSFSLIQVRSQPPSCEVVVELPGRVLLRFAELPPVEYLRGLSMSFNSIGQ